MRPQEIEAILEKLDKFERTLDHEGWDGYDAVSINPQALESARQIIKSIHKFTKAPCVFPVPNGNVQIEWEDLTPGREYYIEVEVGPETASIFTIEGKHENEEEEGIKIKDVLDHLSCDLPFFQYSAHCPGQFQGTKHNDCGQCKANERCASTIYKVPV